MQKVTVRDGSVTGCSVVIVEFTSELFVAFDKIDARLTHTHATRPAKARESADRRVAAFYESGLTQAVSPLEVAYSF